jgi:hypothetical protein
MNAQTEQLLEKLEALPPEQRAEVEAFVDFLAAKARKQAAFDRLLAIAPALQAAGVTPLTEHEINAEIKAVRAERRSRADRS